MTFAEKKITKGFRDAYDAFYGDGEIKPKPVKAPKTKCHKEAHEQIVAVARIRKLGLKVHHSPNGGRRDIKEAVKFKAMGVSAGFPDLFLPYSRKGFHALFIEIKPENGGRVSDAQEHWGNHLVSEGYSWHVAHGADEVMEIVYEYFEDDMHGGI